MTLIKRPNDSCICVQCIKNSLHGGVSISCLVICELTTNELGSRVFVYIIIATFHFDTIIEVRAMINITGNMCSWYCTSMNIGAKYQRISSIRESDDGSSNGAHDSVFASIGLLCLSLFQILH